MQAAVQGATSAENAFTSASRAGTAASMMRCPFSGDAWAVEADLGAKALDQAMNAPDMAQAAVIQAQWAMGWWGRAAETAMGLNAEAARIQAEVMAPVQAAVSANARRLKRG